MARTIFQEAGDVTVGGIYEEDGVIYNQEVMPARYVEDILDSIQQTELPSKKSPIGEPFARVPRTEWHNWRQEWMKGPKLWGVDWDRFVMRKLMSSDYSKLRFNR